MTALIPRLRAATVALITTCMAAGAMAEVSYEYRSASASADWPHCEYSQSGAQRWGRTSAENKARATCNAMGSGWRFDRMESWGSEQPVTCSNGKSWKFRVSGATARCKKLQSKKATPSQQSQQQQQYPSPSSRPSPTYPPYSGGGTVPMTSSGHGRTQAEACASARQVAGSPTAPCNCSRVGSSGQVTRCQVVKMEVASPDRSRPRIRPQNTIEVDRFGRPIQKNCDNNTVYKCPNKNGGSGRRG